MRFWVSVVAALLALGVCAGAAPNRVVDLDAAGLSEGPVAAWGNQGSAAGSFERVLAGGAVVEMVDGRKAVSFDGAKHFFKSDFPAPDTITGNNPYSVAVWVYNPRVDQSEEALVYWARRGSDRQTAHLNYGTSKASGAVVHWGDVDMGYDGGIPAAGQWHHIIVTYEGGENGTENLYVDGKLNVSEKKSLNLWKADPIFIGCADYEKLLSGSLASVQMYDYALGTDEIALLSGSAGKTPRPALIDLSAEKLTLGQIVSWDNEGTAKGSFGLDYLSPTFGTVKGRPAIVFDGKSWLQSSFGSLAALDGKSPFTVELWALNANARLEQGALLSVGGQATRERMRFSLSRPLIDGAFLCGRSKLGLGRPLPEPNVWHHVAYTYSGGGDGVFRVYVDGDVSGESKFTLDAVPAAPLLLGAGWTGTRAIPGMLLQGAISSVRIYDAALTQQELRNGAGMYNAFAPKPGNEATFEGLKVSLGWSVGDPQARLTNLYFSTDMNKVEERAKEASKGSLPATVQAFGPLPVKLGQTYYWRVDQVGGDGRMTNPGTIWQFSVEKGQAGEPSPRTKVSAVSVKTETLAWTPGKYATKQILYFSSNLADVESSSRAAARTLGAKTRSMKAPLALEPSKTYYWRVDNENGKQPATTGEIWSFRTEDKPSWNDVTFFATSDLHFGANETIILNNQASVDLMNSLPGNPYPGQIGGVVGTARGVVLTGDLTNDGTAPQWADFLKVYGLNGNARLVYPVYEGYGNHDGGLDPGRAVVPDMILRNKLRPRVTEISQSGISYSWDWDEVHFIHTNIYPGDVRIRVGNLDGNWNEPYGSLQFLKDDLKKNVGTSGRPVFIMQHYGYKDGFSDGWGWWGAKERENLLEAVKGYNVVGVLFGHTHAATFDKWNGLDLFNVGSGSRDPEKGECFVFHITPTEMAVACRQGNEWGIVTKKPITGLTSIQK